MLSVAKVEERGRGQESARRKWSVLWQATGQFSLGIVATSVDIGPLAVTQVGVLPTGAI